MTMRANQRLEGDVDRLHSELRDIDCLAQQMESEKKVGLVYSDFHNLLFYVPEII